MADLDPFDEFEFKPLTEGLGFHKKSIKLNDQVKKTNLSQEHLPRSFPPAPPAQPEEGSTSSASVNPRQTLEEILKSLERPQQSVQVTQPLPRESTKQPSAKSPVNRDAVPLKANMVQPQQAPGGVVQGMDLPFMDIPEPGAPVVPEETPQPLVVPAPAIGTRRGAADSPLVKLTPVSMSLSSALLDLVAVVALGLIFMIVLLTITESSLASIVASAQTDLTIQVSLAILFLAVMQMYVVISRSFFGRTLGEWTFDLQMGSDEQHEKSGYPLRILWRSILVTMTGIVLLPTLSLIFRRDLLAPLTGLQLYRQRF